MVTYRTGEHMHTEPFENVDKLPDFAPPVTPTEEQAQGVVGSVWVWVGFCFCFLKRPKPTDIFRQKKKRSRRFHFRFTKRSLNWCAGERRKPPYSTFSSDIYTHIYVHVVYAVMHDWVLLAPIRDKLPRI